MGALAIENALLEKVDNLSEHIDHFHEIGSVKKACKEVKAKVQD